jgi:hypothetical protein
MKYINFCLLFPLSLPKLKPLAIHQPQAWLQSHRPSWKHFLQSQRTTFRQLWHLGYSYRLCARLTKYITPQFLSVRNCEMTNACSFKLQYTSRHILSYNPVLSY